MIKIFWVILILAILYLLALRGRSGHPGVEKLRGWNYTHRGLHSPGVPENSLAAFRAAVDHGYGSEFDVHLLKDGGLAVIHDSKLVRTTGREGVVEDLPTEELKECFLEGTTETIPTFWEVLEIFSGKAPVIIELKPEGGNVAQLCEAACAAMEGFEGVWCMESFDPRVTRWLRKNRPDIIRGQLSENWMKSSVKLPWVLKFVMTFHISNIYTRPDFIAYKYADRKAFGTDICRKFWGIQGVSWTLKTKEEYDTAVNEGWIPIFEGFEP